MRILILGGTVFLGRAVVESALARGHEVTIFSRGQRNPDLFPEVEKLRGDRNGNLEALKGRQWDAVIDTSGFVPRIVSDSARLLADQAEHYTFISSISVYRDPAEWGLAEDAAVGTLEDPTVEEITGPTYGPLKALCEQAAEAAMPGRTLVIRPGLIVGPHDPSDRFTYWPVRIARGGEVLAPGSPDRQVQVIDVRDLAEWNVRMTEARQTGIYNATGPVGRLTMGQMLSECREALQSDAGFTWVSEPFLAEQKVGPWMELPLWLPEDGPVGLMGVNIDRGLAAGLTFRPLTETARDTVAWASGRPAEHAWRAGLKPEREEALLRAWREH